MNSDTHKIPPSRHNSFYYVWRCYRYLRPYWKITTAAYIFVLILTVINMIYPQIIRLAIDQGIGGKQTVILGYSVLGLTVLTLIKGFFTFFQGRWTESASQGVAFDLRGEIQKKLTILSFSFHNQSEAGELLTRAIQDVDRIRFLTGRATLRIFDSLLLLVSSAAIMFWMSPKLALLTIIALPILVYRSADYSNRLRPLSMNIQKKLSILTTVVEQSLRGARVVKAFTREKAEIDHFDQKNQEWLDVSIQSARIQALETPLFQLIINLATIIIMWYGGYLVIQNQLTLGELVSFTTYIGQLARPIRMLGNVLVAMTNAATSAERIFEIIDEVPEISEIPDALPLKPVKGHVHFDNVTFAYGKRISVLNNITFEANPGQIIALLGTTGSGKTTITNLVSRFYDPTAGKIYVDGVDIQKVTLNSLRSQIGMVLQDSTLFATTIRENITFGKPIANEEEIIAAARAAQAHEFIIQTPKGYDTYVGEKGITLSGGQKQRLAIARALLTDPRILILDDALSSVDSETEHLIQIALDELMRGRTTFVIAHRINTVMRADLILVLDKGRIIARGNHQELIKTSDLYNRIYQRQLKPAERGI